MRTTVLWVPNSMLLMSQTQISDIPSFWSSSQFHATVANYSICPILIGLLRLTVANQSECRICQFSLRSDSTVAKIDQYMGNTLRCISEGCYFLSYSPLRNDPQTGNYKRIFGREFLKQLTLRINVINLSK
jgi:hypothetical protein